MCGRARVKIKMTFTFVSVSNETQQVSDQTVGEPETATVKYHKNEQASLNTVKCRSLGHLTFFLSSKSHPTRQKCPKNLI